MSRRSLFLFVFALTFVTAAVPARAVTLESGAVEVQPSFAYAHSTAEVSGYNFKITADQLTGTFRLGQCMNSHFEFTGSTFFQYQSFRQTGGYVIAFGGTSTFPAYSVSSTQFGATIGGQFNFPTSSKVAPYLGIEVGAILPDEGDAVSILPQVRGGMRVFINPGSAVDLGIGWQHLNTSGSSTLSTTFVVIGLSVFPGRH
jgi:hypothetical protein